MNPRGTPANLRPFKKGHPGMGGRPPEPWRQWLLSMEPEVRARWLDTFRRAKPALRARMIEQSRLRAMRDEGGDDSSISVAGDHETGDGGEPF